MKKIFVFYLLLMLGMFLLLLRLFELQVVLGERNRELAEGNRIKKEIFSAPRGIIFDRNEKPLVRNVPVYRIKRDNDQTPSTKYQTISREEALKIETEGGEEAERLRVDVGRDYLFGPVLAHVLGYLDWELKGTTGVEGKYDQILAGQDGGEIYEVDTQGNKVREIGKVEPVAGKDIYLSLDGELSKIAYEALEGRSGAVVATEAKTGRVLVLVSSPSFNPNRITPEILADPTKPLFNRAIGGVYPPGSTFKIVTAVAGLEEGKIKETTLIEDPGIIRIGDYSYANWYFTKYGKTEGKIGIIRAIKRSTDTFFYKVGELVGAGQLAEWAHAFGLGRKTGIDIAGEVTGLVPDVSQRWFLGNTYHFSIGQANLLTTPLQINMMTSVIANKGRLCRPRIARYTSEDCQDLHLQPKTLELVQEGLKEACSPGGTASVFFNFTPQVGCKTGTAEYGDPQGRTHAWLTAYAPADDPQIVVTALVEGGGEGSITAAPIVKKVMEEWFKDSPFLRPHEKKIGG